MLLANTPLDAIWEGLLSHDPSEIKRVFYILDSESQQVVLLHLQRMVSEPGWLPVQQQSAQIALEVLQPINKTDQPSQE